mmetsp:Transcript_1083/g.3841  ORF Transcript_1083/g.3841 Transcript_1083/m.3841 type:complete len:210 (-) Transcript_1083:629-1258(-)
MHAQDLPVPVRGNKAVLLRQHQAGDSDRSVKFVALIEAVSVPDAQSALLPSQNQVLSLVSERQMGDPLPKLHFRQHLGVQGKRVEAEVALAVHREHPVGVEGHPGWNVPRGQLHLPHVLAALKGVEQDIAPNGGADDEVQGHGERQARNFVLVAAQDVRGVLPERRHGRLGLQGGGLDPPHDHGRVPAPRDHNPLLQPHCDAGDRVLVA